VVGCRLSDLSGQEREAVYLFQQLAVTINAFILGFDEDAPDHKSLIPAAFKRFLPTRMTVA